MIAAPSGLIEDTGADGLLQQTAAIVRKAAPQKGRPTVADLRPVEKQVTGIYLRVMSREGRALSGALPQVFSVLRSDTSITVAQPSHQIQTLFTVVGGVEQIFAALVGIVFVSSILAIGLALYNSTEQRRRQIALLRVLGFSRPRIVLLTLTESALLGILGGLAGSLVSMAGVVVAASILRTRYGLDLEPMLLTRWTILVIAGSVVMSVIAGVIPAAIAYRVPVVRHLTPVA